MTDVLVNFDSLADDELMLVDGGGIGLAIWTGIKVVGAIAGVSAAGLVVGAGGVLIVYYGCKWLLG